MTHASSETNCPGRNTALAPWRVVEFAVTFPWARTLLPNPLALGAGVTVTRGSAPRSLRVCPWVSAAWT